MAGFQIPTPGYDPRRVPPPGPTTRPNVPIGQTPYTGVGTPGASPYVPEEATAQRQRETTRLGQQTGIEGQSRLGKEQAGYGTAATTQAGEIASGARQQEAELQAGAETRRFNQFSPYFQSLFGSAGGGGGAAIPPREQYGMGGQADAARAAAFARAKDQAGNISRASLTGLQNAMGARGISGSGIELGQMGEIIGGAGRELGEVNREQLIQDLAAAQHGADVQYTGGIEQRGQDIQAEQARRAALIGLFNQQFGGNITARY